MVVRSRIGICSTVFIVGDDCSVVSSQTARRTALMGLPQHVAVERALSEFRCGRPVIMTHAEERTIALPVDGMSDEQLAAFRQLCAPNPLRLVVTERRADSLGLAATGPIALTLNETDGAAEILSLAVDAQVARRLDGVALGATANAAIELAKV